MLTKIIKFVKTNLNQILLFIIVILLTLLSFSIGYLFAKYQSKEPIKIEKIYESS